MPPLQTSPPPDSIPIAGPASIPTRRRRPSVVALDEAIGCDIARISLFGRRQSVLVARDEWIHRVLVEDADSYRKGPLLSVTARPLLGDGLLTGDNDLNRRQRRVISPAFAHRRVADYAGTVASYTQRETERWRDGATIDLPNEMLALTLGIIGELLLGEDLLRRAKRVGDALVILMNFALDQARASPWAVIGIPRAYLALAYLNGILRSRIEERLRAADEDAAAEADLLSRLVLGGAFGEDGERTADRMPPALVRDETMTLFLAGLETVAIALVWGQYLLATHPGAYARVQAEVDALGHDPGYEDLPNLPYTLQVFKETMRLYPPAYVVARQALRATTIGPHRLEPGTVVLVSPYVQHRHPGHFADPLHFDPDRWAAPDAERRLPARYAYMPFGGGPRICVGGHFALLEGHLILAMLARRFTLRVAPGQTISPQPLFTLRPDRGLRMVVERRG